MVRSMDLYQHRSSHHPILLDYNVSNQTNFHYTFPCNLLGVVRGLATLDLVLRGTLAVDSIGEVGIGIWAEEAPLWLLLLIAVIGTCNNK